MRLGLVVLQVVLAVVGVVRHRRLRGGRRNQGQVDRGQRVLFAVLIVLLAVQAVLSSADLLHDASGLGRWTGAALVLGGLVVLVLLGLALRRAIVRRRPPGAPWWRTTSWASDVPPATVLARFAEEVAAAGGQLRADGTAEFGSPTALRRWQVYVDPDRVPVELAVSAVPHGTGSVVRARVQDRIGPTVAMSHDLDVVLHRRLAEVLDVAGRATLAPPHPVGPRSRVLERERR